VSVGAWLLAQFDLGKFAYNLTIVFTGVPFRETGSFEMFAWQFIWILGLWMGLSEIATPDTRPQFPRWLIGTAAVIALRRRVREGGISAHACFE
jgi:hypothetical protein